MSDRPMQRRIEPVIRGGKICKGEPRSVSPQRDGATDPFKAHPAEDTGRSERQEDSDEADDGASAQERAKGFRAGVLGAVRRERAQTALALVLRVEVRERRVDECETCSAGILVRCE